MNLSATDFNKWLDSHWYKTIYLQTADFNKRWNWPFGIIERSHDDKGAYIKWAHHHRVVVLRPVPQEVWNEPKGEYVVQEELYK